MENVISTGSILLLPLIGTTVGAAMVFFIRSRIPPRLEKFLMGFAAGVMIAASVWSLIIPSIEMSENMGRASFIPAAVGFLLGAAFLLLLDMLIPHLHVHDDHPEGIKSHFGKSAMLVFAVTLHNFPEGMAVGVVLAGALSGSATVTVAGAFSLAAGIAIQNSPEGAIVSMPLYSAGRSRSKAFLYGALSGLAEPVGALLTLGLISIVTPALPYILSFAAGAMMYVVVEELIPQSQADAHSNMGTVGAALGFVLMMILDITLG